MMKIARYIDHAVLDPAMTPEEVRAAIQLGIDNDVYSVCVQPRDIETALAMCKGTNTLVSSVLDYPHGCGGAAAKREAARLYAADWRQAVSQMQAEGRRFDLVFLDPPYRLPVLEECCAALADAALLEADALMVLEHRLDTPPAPDARFALWKDRAYGDTAIHFFHYRGGAL